MRRYRAVQGKEAGWQTEAVKTALRLFRGLFEKTDEEDEKTDASGEETAVQEKGRICFPGFEFRWEIQRWLTGRPWKKI